MDDIQEVYEIAITGNMHAFCVKCAEIFVLDMKEGGAQSWVIFSSSG